MGARRVPQRKSQSFSDDFSWHRAAPVEITDRSSGSTLTLFPAADLPDDGIGVRGERSQALSAITFIRDRVDGGERIREQRFRQVRGERGQALSAITLKRDRAGGGERFAQNGFTVSDAYRTIVGYHRVRGKRCGWVPFSHGNHRLAKIKQFAQLKEFRKFPSSPPDQPHWGIPE